MRACAHTPFRGRVQENLLAVSACGPGHVIKVYDKAALTCVAQLAGHTATVNELQFAPADPQGLYSASSDGTLRLWDLRAPAPNVHTFNTGGKEVWAASMSSDSTFVAGGVASALRTWDLRTRKAYRSYVDAHTDDVTCVRAHPAVASVFVTGSEDGLICAINNACADMDDAIETVINVNCAIARVGFLGAQVALCVMIYYVIYFNIIWYNIL
jgi:WD40 repeat protein